MYSKKNEQAWVMGRSIGIIVHVVLAALVLLLWGCTNKPLSPSTDAANAAFDGLFSPSLNDRPPGSIPSTSGPVIVEPGQSPSQDVTGIPNLPNGSNPYDELGRLVAPGDQSLRAVVESGSYVMRVALKSTPPAGSIYTVVLGRNVSEFYELNFCPNRLSGPVTGLSIVMCLKFESPSIDRTEIQMEITTPTNRFRRAIQVLILPAQTPIAGGNVIKLVNPINPIETNRNFVDSNKRSNVSNVVIQVLDSTGKPVTVDPKLTITPAQPITISGDTFAITISKRGNYTISADRAIPLRVSVRENIIIKAGWLTNLDNDIDVNGVRCGFVSCTNGSGMNHLFKLSGRRTEGGPEKDEDFLVSYDPNVPNKKTRSFYDYWKTADTNGLKYIDLILSLNPEARSVSCTMTVWDRCNDNDARSKTLDIPQ